VAIHKVELAIRGSRNRPDGTPVTKTIDSVTNVEYRQSWIEKHFPERAVQIQQDNARPLILPTEPAFVAMFYNGIEH
jgi:hypothetical protein